MSLFFFVENCQKTYQLVYEKQQINLERPNGDCSILTTGPDSPGIPVCPIGPGGPGGPGRPYSEKTMGVILHEAVPNEFFVSRP